MIEDGVSKTVMIDCNRLSPVFFYHKSPEAAHQRKEIVGMYFEHIISVNKIFS